LLRATTKNSILFHYYFFWQVRKLRLTAYQMKFYRYKFNFGKWNHFSFFRGFFVNVNAKRAFRLNFPNLSWGGFLGRVIHVFLENCYKLS
jgi:hypothetical protein